METDASRGARPGADALVERGGVTILVAAWDRPFPGLVAAVSTRAGGVSRDPFGMNTSFRVGDSEPDVRRNRERFFEAAGIPGGMIATAGQVHGANLAVADHPGYHPECDGLVTDRAGLYLGVSVADCVPIMLYDDNKKAAGIVHSGWRGSRARIVERCVAFMGERFGCRVDDLHAYIGPSAGGCCYEVGEEVAAHFPPEALEKTNSGRFRLDLGVFNRNLLLRAGLPEGQIRLSGRCTIHEAETFHSHRRDRERSGRMLAVIGIAAGVGAS
jgi:YfiH family protein